MTGCGGGGGGGGGSTGGTSFTPGGASTDSSHGTASCAGNAIFNTSPIALNSVVGWVPLGNMEPTGHTFPTDHQYLYLANPTPGSTVTVPVVAPADMTIWMLYQTSGSESEYTIWAQSCAQVIMRLGSITALSSDLLAAAGPINQSCSTSSPSLGSTNTQCQVNLSYNVKAGQPIGSITSTTPYALDFWLWDSRVTPIHFTDPAKFTTGPYTGFLESNIVAASDYFTGAISAQIGAKIGAFDGSQARTASPPGGTIAVDVDRTARGYWFNPAQAYPPETYQAALAPDNITPATTEVISLGASQVNTGGLRDAFTPVSSGLVNRAFEQVTADGNIYCYQGIAENTAGATRVVLLQMLSASSLKIEQLASNLTSCAAAQPWTFSTLAFTYSR
jgi:hypothetical protein